MRKTVLIIVFALSLKEGLAQNEGRGLQADTVATSPVEMEEVMVTATRTKSTGLSLPYSLNKITSADLDRFQFRTAPEALSGATGIFLQKTNHGGGSPFIRGLTGNQVLILVDGIRMNNATFRYGPNQYLNTIDAYTIEAVEIARGTGSVQYGSDALGGVVQVFTKEPAFSAKKNWKFSGTGKMMSHDMEYTGRGSVQYQSERLAVSAGYTKRNFGDLYGGDTTGKQTPSGYQEQAVDAKLKWKLSENAMLVMAHTYLQQNNVPLYHRVKLENFRYYNFDPLKNRLSYATLHIDGKRQLLKKIAFTASYQRRTEIRSYQKNNSSFRYSEKDKVNTTGITADVSSVVNSKWSFNSGMEWYFDKVNSNKNEFNRASGSALTQRGLYPDKSTSGNYSMYSLHHFKWHRWVVEAGIRYNLFTISISDLTLTPATLDRKKAFVYFHPSSLVANAALLYKLNARQSVYGSYSTGYRAPNIDDMGTLGLVDFRYEVPTANLSPEKTYHSEIGYRFASPALNISTAFFYMQMADIITRVKVEGSRVDGYQVYRKENSQKSFIHGAEFTLNWRMAPHWKLMSGAAFAYGQNSSFHEPMRRIPPFNGRILLDYNKNRWQWAAEQQFALKQSRLAQGDRDDNRIPKGGTPGWNIINIYGSYGAGYLYLRAGVQNVFNRDYRTHGSGINGIGRSAWMAIQLNL